MTQKRIRPYLIAVGGVGIASALTAVLLPWIEPSVSLLFFPVVVASALIGGYGPALLSTVLSTVVLAYYFVPPVGSLNIGVDDAIRLAVFIGVAFVTASIASGRNRAEEALRRSLSDLQEMHETLRRVREWPMTTGRDTAAAVPLVLRHAATVVGCIEVIAIWEDEEEPRVCIARSLAGHDVLKYCPPELLLPLVPATLESASFACADVLDAQPLVYVNRAGGAIVWSGCPVEFSVRQYVGEGAVGSAPFLTEHLTGRAFFSGLHTVSGGILPRLELAAREIGMSLEQLRVAEHLRLLAIRDERTRVARDLHDGMLQALSGVRLELQTLQRTDVITPEVRHRLEQVDDVLAREQRDLRHLIDRSRLEAPAQLDTTTPIAQLLEDVASRLRVEWRVPLTIDVEPSMLSLPHPTARALQLMVHEGIVNALKHSRPTHVEVRVRSTDGEVHVVIANDGRGFPFRGHLTHEELIAGNLGPVTLRERATALGGTIAVDSSGSGARVELTIPAASASRA
jgi:signal transduction histidine kinase